MRRLAIFLLLGVLAPRANAELPPVRAVRTDRPIVVDGLLDEEVWKNDQAITNFTQEDPDQGVPPRQRTEVRVAYDDDALYVGARMYDSAPDSVVARLARRDSDARDDQFAVYLDPFHDKRTGYYFVVSAASTLQDGVLLNDGWNDSSWDGVWQGRAHRDAHGWTCELRIPFSQLRFRAGTQMVWGVDFKRALSRYSELDAVVYTPRGQSGFVSRFPEMHGMDGLKTGRHLELTPYLTSKTEHLDYNTSSLSLYDPADPFHSGWNSDPAVGGDLRTSLGSRLTLNATVNPDFGQVEIDPAVVNLSDVESFFQEKRPFFTEGVSVFRCGNNGANDYDNFNWPEPTFFYSRRIGRGPQGSTPDSLGTGPNRAAVDFTDVPSATHILGAAKITGQAAPGWNVGTVQALTSREEARLQTAGVESKYGVEPMSYYGVWRALHEMNDRRQGLGLMAMTTARFFEGSGDPLRDEVNSGSVVAAMDGWTFLDKSRTWVISGYATGSHVQGSTTRIASLESSAPHYYQRPDRPDLGLNPNATSLAGWGSRLWLNKQQGKIIFNAGLGAISPGFDNNDLGFLNGADVVNTHVMTGWQWNQPRGWRQFANIMGAVTSGWDFGGNNTFKGAWINGNLEQRNHWSWNANSFYNGRGYNSRRTRGGPVMLTQPDISFNAYFDTDGSKPWFWSISVSPSASQDGSWAQEVNPTFQWRPKSNLALSGGPDLYRGHTDTQWIENVAPTTTTGSRFAHLEQTQISGNLRADYAATPNVSVQLYLQPLVSTLRYHGLVELARSRTYEFVPVALMSNGNPVETFSGTFGSLRGNLVVRWEYLPGSSAYFVWTQERADEDAVDEFDMNHSYKVVSTAPANNVFLIKVAHHFDL
jgi:hypothetical protein